jgi:hypothetical protein
MPTTTNYSIVLPTVGSSKNTWGSELNDAFQSLETEVYNVDTTLGDVSDSATPSLAYNLAQASTNASTALTNSQTALSVANKQVNTTLTTLTSRVSALETLVGDVGTTGSVADDARSAKTTAQNAYTAATT